MKPKPFASLNHFTVPLAILMLLIGGDISPHIHVVSRCGDFWDMRLSLRSPKRRFRPPGPWIGFLIREDVRLAGMGKAQLSTRSPYEIYRATVMCCVSLGRT